MKRLSYIIWVCSLSGMILVSCQKDFLNRDNPKTINYQDVWNDPSLIGLFVNNIYNDLPAGWVVLYADIADEGRRNSPSGGGNTILIGQWDDVKNPMDDWAPTYSAIRECNEFFKDIKNSPVDTGTKNEYTGEVKFLRAFFYFQLVKRYGGVPLITEAQSLSDSLLVKRNTLDECFNFITGELDEAAALLPEKADKGRATKGAALALKGRALLYYASPLYNPDNEKSRWAAAAAANKAVMDLGIYQLYPDIKNLWLDPSNLESIFEEDYHLPEKYTGWDSELQPLVLAHGNAGQCSPVQELINGFPMKNGKSIWDPSSGYDPQNPYIGRDDRFYAYIGYNGSTMQGFDGTKLVTITLQVYKGGRDYDSVPSHQVYTTITGYYTLKGKDPSNTVYYNAYGSTTPWMFIRYAEVLLNYAEAENEAVGPDANVYTAIESIRTRAGITNPLSAGISQDSMRNLIRNERYVELCFEDKRYWDLRRWKLATTYLNGKVYTGVVATKNPGGGFTYQYGVPIAPIPVFDEKMYWMPIPHSEILKDPNLQQNPGWPQ